jgi:ferredoxin/flavodoxin---NADP+ reductase
MADPAGLRVAVVGSGPAAFFTAEPLLGRTDRAVTVDMFERLPAPFGLVRFGVAPDHQKIKSVTRSFDKVARRPGFRFFGNVDVGAHLTLDDLRRHYHVICFATGAQTDRRLGIPGEDLARSHPATEFVAWYNGHPDYRDLVFDLSVRRVAVIGVGNVAVDVARILSRTPAELARTDIADYAETALAASGVREVYLIGRRGPVQAAFTTPEVRELGELEGADVVVPPEDVVLDPLSRAALAAADDRALEKKVEILQDYSARQRTGKPRTLTLRFLLSPVEILADDAGGVRAMRLVRNRLEDDGRGGARAAATGQIEELPVDLVFRSVGYRGMAIPGLPFDERSGTVPHERGRVMAGGAPLPGVYVSGWIKRGPSGVIGTNKPDAAETVETILADAAAGLLPEPAEARSGGGRADGALPPAARGRVRRLVEDRRRRGGSRGRVRPAAGEVHDGGGVSGGGGAVKTGTTGGVVGHPGCAAG